MKIFNNKAAAVLIAILVVAGSTTVNAGVRLRAACEDAEQAFYSSESGKAPYYYVNSAISASTSLISIADHYSDSELTAAAQELSSARRALDDAYSDRDIAGMGAETQALLAAAEKYRQAAQGVVFTEADQSTYSDALTDVQGSCRNAAGSSYNSDTEKFIRKTCESFPASLFMQMFSIDEPSLFRSNWE